MSDTVGWPQICASRSQGKKLGGQLELGRPATTHEIHERARAIREEAECQQNPDRVTLSENARKLGSEPTQMPRHGLLDRLKDRAREWGLIHKGLSEEEIETINGAEQARKTIEAWEARRRPNPAGP